MCNATYLHSNSQNEMTGALGKKILEKDILSEICFMQ